MNNAKPDNISINLENIKQAILGLKATGEDGFEGLLRIVLTSLSGIPFRLAASGLQGGKDGDAALPKDHICFEAKRYDGDIPRNEVLTKIGDLARHKIAPDNLWVLGATTEVRAQLASDVKSDGDRNAISTLILDWTAAPLPLLALAIVESGIKAIDFLITNYNGKSSADRIDKDALIESFKGISTHPEFAPLLERTKASFNTTSLGFALAIERNEKWKHDKFSSAHLSRQHLGQSLAISENPNLPELRKELRNDILGKIKSGNDIILSGDEGHGKSWLAAQVCLDHKGIALFISAERFDGIAVNKLEEFLIDMLLEQTDEITDDIHKIRWRHRFQAWKNQPSITPILVVVDGVNQRQNLRWDRLLNGLQGVLAEISGRLIVTVRPLFWQKAVFRGLAFKPSTITIPEWSAYERDVLLKYYRIGLNWLDAKTLETLKNPRLLGIAVSILPHQEASAWKGLTTDRLLMEHLRTSQLENFENETFAVLTKRLSEHAKKVLERLSTSTTVAPQNFASDSGAVIETRFYRPLVGPGDLYELREEGLTLALGFALVDQLWQADRAKLNLHDHVVRLIEPIIAMDRTTDVLFSSLLVCSFDEYSRFDKAIFTVLLDAFANLQNISEKRLDEFVEITKRHPDLLFDVLKGLCLEIGRRVNHDWFVFAAFEIAGSESGWSIASEAIQQWFRHYNTDPVTQTNRFWRNGEAEYEGKVANKKVKIAEILSSLSAFESQLMKEMREIPEETDELFTLALRLLSGHPLAPFAESFVAMGLAFTLDENLHSSKKAFNQLTAFNRVDIEATSTAFLKAIAPLRGQPSSQGGQWTVVRMLYATGDENSAKEASQLAGNLRKDWPSFPSSPPDEWRSVKFANPEALRPINLDDGLHVFNAIAPDKILQNMMVGREDIDYRDLLPVICRFEPSLAIEKTRSLMRGLQTRAGMPLRQVLVNCEENIPLIESEFAKQFIERISDSNVIDSVPEGDRLICRMFAFYYAVEQLSAEEQLKCITGVAMGSDYLLSIIPSLKAQPTAEILTALQLASKENNETAAYGVLTAALYGGTQITSELEALILQYSLCESSKLRAVSFSLAVKNQLHNVQAAHINGPWAASQAYGNTYEDWFGSILLINAFAKGTISVEDLLKRISHKTWFETAIDLGDEFSAWLGANFIQRLRQEIKAIGNNLPPAADFTLSSHALVPYPFVSIEETERNIDDLQKQDGPKENFGRVEDFDKRQGQLTEIANKFFESLNSLDVHQIVQQIEIQDLRRIIDITPTLMHELTEIIRQADDTQFVWLKNISFLVANLISREKPTQAVALFERAMSSQGFVIQALGDNLTIEHEAIWSSENSDQMKALWSRRILCAKNDSILANEVLAAERFGAAKFIQNFVYELASSNNSLDRAYAVTIAGYSENSDAFDEIVKRNQNNAGMPGYAAKNSRSEIESFKWAQGWVENMWDATTAEEFWQCLIIAKTCIDARISKIPKPNSKWGHYSPLFQQARRKSIKERNKEREKRLLGQDAPDEIFIRIAS